MVCCRRQQRISCALYSIVVVVVVVVEQLSLFYYSPKRAKTKEEKLKIKKNKRRQVHTSTCNGNDVECTIARGVSCPYFIWSTRFSTMDFVWLCDQSYYHRDVIVRCRSAALLLLFDFWASPQKLKWTKKKRKMSKRQRLVNTAAVWGHTANEFAVSLISLLCLLAFGRLSFVHFADGTFCVIANVRVACLCILLSTFIVLSPTISTYRRRLAGVVASTVFPPFWHMFPSTQNYNKDNGSELKTIKSTAFCLLWQFLVATPTRSIHIHVNTEHRRFGKRFSCETIVIVGRPMPKLKNSIIEM